MKKIYLLFLGAFVSGTVMAQSQRLVLVEEFTQASCGPCAAQNPAFNTLLNANTSKAVSIKYQTSWPGVDPMNAANPAQVQTRVTYYGVNGVPTGIVDGVEIANDCNAYAGAPACLSQAEIDANYAVTSPFTLTLSHTLSNDYDSVYITASATASQAFSSGAANSLKLHIVLVEKEINYDTPPGSNGEKDFYGVMRRMLPTDQGTTLTDNWALNDNSVVTVGAPIPGYLCDLNELQVVAFIQDNSNKTVLQAAVSTPILFADDGGVTAVTNIPLLSCATSFTPSITVKNFGSTTLTSGTINYQVDAQTPQTQNWTGSLAPGASTSVALSSPIAATAGSHTFKAWVTSVNGSTDYNEACSQEKTVKYNIMSTGVATFNPEGFTSTAFPPQGMIIDNPDGGAGWSRVTSAGGFGNSNNAARMYFYASTTGNIDYMYLPALDFTNVTAPRVMTFHLAYAQYSNENDVLAVEVSTNCGTSWTTKWTKSGSNMSTANATQSNFVPNASQWRTEEVDLASVAGEGHVLVRFKAISAYGNNLYIDNINIAATNSISEAVKSLDVNVFPNPANDHLNVNLNLDENESVVIRISDIAGRVVFEENKQLNSGFNTLRYSLEGISSGMYQVNIIAGDKQSVSKIQVVR